MSVFDNNINNHDSKEQTLENALVSKGPPKESIPTSELTVT